MKIYPFKKKIKNEVYFTLDKVMNGERKIKFDFQ